MKGEEGVDWQIRLAQMKASLPLLREYMEWVVESYSLYAKQYRAYFDALVTAGFSAEQALEIVKAQGWIPK